MKKFTYFFLLFLCLSCNKKEKSTPSVFDQYAIVYNVRVDEINDNYDVRVLTDSNKKPIKITQDKGVEWSYISQDNKILYISDVDTCQRCFRLYQSDWKGSQIQKVSDTLLADSWMSTRKGGKEIIVKPKNDRAFYIFNLENWELLKKIKIDLPYFSDPLFIDDGNKIVFRGGQQESKLIPGFNEELYIAPVEGSELIQLTQYPKNDTTVGDYGYRAGAPKLHPTEQFISYQSKQNGKYSLYATTFDGKKNWKLTDIKQNEGWHDWSPDGKWLAVEIFDSNQTQFSIVLLNWDTKEWEIISDSVYSYQHCPNFVRKKD